MTRETGSGNTGIRDKFRGHKVGVSLLIIISVLWVGSHFVRTTITRYSSRSSSVGVESNMGAFYVKIDHEPFVVSQWDISNWTAGFWEDGLNGHRVQRWRGVQALHYTPEWATRETRVVVVSYWLLIVIVALLLMMSVMRRRRLRRVGE